MANNIDMVDAIIAIKSDSKVSCINNDINRINWIDGNPSGITNDAILAKQTELQADFDAKQYQRDRTTEDGYPSIGDQMDMMWHDKKDGTTTWEDAVEAVKDAHPKP